MAALFEDKKGGGNGLFFFLCFCLGFFFSFLSFSLLYFCGVDPMLPSYPYYTVTLLSVLYC